MKKEEPKLKADLLKKPESGEWEMQVVRSLKDCNTLLEAGYEPFAVDGGAIYLKKKLKKGVLGR